MDENDDDDVVVDASVSIVFFSPSVLVFQCPASVKFNQLDHSLLPWIYTG